jgi:hypothetical protein
MIMQVHWLLIHLEDHLDHLFRNRHRDLHIIYKVQSIINNYYFLRESNSLSFSNLFHLKNLLVV